ncbi:PAP2-domain-containing protein [Fistulina hepatica ATCC 64428]|uniref:PAP2-domain-containing protein n=1 Tax=Fistulina hepatica ATCC 64428 TaxID=1128425 RepID=A0A0D7ADV2_9AGAR|nr:PAP2-domain-containing protein [Fistulina hepatica ATCC 64428]
MLSRYAAIIWNAFVAAVGRLDKSLSPRDTFERLRKHRFTLADSIYIYHIANAILWFSLMKFPPFPLTVMIPILWVIGLIIPLTSQFLLPATPVLTWVLTFYASRFTPVHWRPNISVSLLPALEVVLYGANISDILTRFTHPLLDILAWLPYGVVHFTFPFVVAALLWLFRDKAVLHLWARAFGYMNLIGVLVQILMPCAAPWYELIYGLTPATYAIRGSPGGLARIDALFHSNGYATTFGSSPVVFGAFPSLHAGCATMEALFMSHFFPQCTRYIWTYVGVLYWATMYLTHHYLIDVVGGACLATMCFYLYLPDELRSTAAATAPPGGNNSRAGRLPRTKYDVYDLSPPRTGGIGEDFELSDESVSEDEEMDITYRAPNGRNANGIARPARIADAQSHRHTASIASLIRSDERTDEGWSPINSAFSPAGR